MTPGTETMSMPRRRTLIPLFLGLAAVALTLVGANRYLHKDAEIAANMNGDGGAAPLPQPQQANKTTSVGRGPTVLGVVDSAPMQIFGLPETMASGRVKKLHVEDGSLVTPGTPIIEFEDYLAKADLATAEAAMKTAEIKVNQAKQQEEMLVFKIAQQELAVKAAEEEFNSGKDMLERGRERVERFLSGLNPNNAQPFTDTEKNQYRRDNLELQKGEAGVRLLAFKVAGEQKKLEEVKSLKPNLLTQEATAELKRYTEVANKAKYAVDACVVKATTAGVVERISVSVGQTVYPQSPVPVLVVPAGPRYVRAEVDPEFAFKVSGTVGKTVAIVDNSNFALSYEGRVKRIGTAFLPKRKPGLDAFTGSATSVLEVLVEVIDPSPAGKPPLLVGQPVRVSFP